MTLREERGSKRYLDQSHRNEQELARCPCFYRLKLRDIQLLVAFGLWINCMRAASES